MERRLASWPAAAPAAAGLIAATLAAWVLVLWPVLDMHGALARLMMPHGAAWNMANLVAVFLMWSVMMAAMMLPGAMPMLLLYDRLVRRAEGAARRTGLFVAAYLALWTLFSLGATLAQWGLHTALLLTPMGRSTSPALTAALFLVAGLYQFTPMKRACLTGCRSPLGFLTTEWRGGDWGALVMGLRHGILCVGCCWALMALVFVGGTMNLMWMAVLTLAVTLEKLAFGGRWFDAGLGAALFAAGLTCATLLAL
ncbi:MAG TPA: DUF2182 domain-containing protein [Azospirillum sp.]